MHGDGGVDAVGVVGAEVVEMAWAARTYVAVEWVDEGTQLELWVSTRRPGKSKVFQHGTLGHHFQM